MRHPAAAGRYYARFPEEIERELDNSFRNLEREVMPAYGAVVPHASILASGAVAAEVYARLPRRDTYILIGPSHTGLGLPVALSRESWMTPMGSIDCDLELADALFGSIIEQDETAHMYEHSLEVQLPFLQRSFNDFKILPICLGLQDEETAVEVGDAVASAIKKVGRDCTVLASSDFTHYEPQEVAVEKDSYVIESVLDMDVPELYRRVYDKNVTACGYGPIAATITASRILGATTGKLLRYATSGDILHDYSQVVGYGAILFL